MSVPRLVVSALRLVAVAMAATLASVDPSLALNISTKNSRNDGTVGHQKGLKDYDNIKRYGAERVRDRDRTPFQPDGMRLGNFIFYPSLAGQTIYDDNFDAVPEGKEGELRYEVEPRLEIRSDLPRHILDFIAGGRFVAFQEHSDQNYAEGYSDVIWRVDINHAHALYGALHASREFEEQGTAEAPLGASEAVPVTNLNADIGLKRDAGRLAAQLDFSAQSFDFDDIKALNGDILDQDYRDNRIFRGDFTLNYRFSPGYEFVVSTGFEKIDNRGDEFIDRDSQSYAVGAGLQFEFNPLIRGSLMGAYAHRDYRLSELRDFSSWLYEAELQWLPTELLTVYATAGQNIAETGYEDASARKDTKFGLSVEYEIWRNMVATAGATASWQDYLGTDRLDSVYVGNIGIEYYFNKNILFNLSYEYQVRDSELDEFDYTRNLFRFGVKLRN